MEVSVEKEVADIRIEATGRFRIEETAGLTEVVREEAIEALIEVAIGASIGAVIEVVIEEVIMLKNNSLC